MSSIPNRRVIAPSINTRCIHINWRIDHEDLPLSPNHEYDSFIDNGNIYSVCKKCLQTIMLDISPQASFAVNNF